MLIQARRKLIRSASPFAFPGTNPGFDPSHPLAKGISAGHGFSGVATSGFVSLITGAIGTVTGAPTAKILAPIGQTQTFGTTDNFLFSGQATTNDSAATLAAILQPNAFVGNYSVIRNSSTTAGIDLLVSSTVVQVSGPGVGGATQFTFALTAGTPYYLAASQGPGYVGYVIRNLLTGQFFTFTAGGTTTTLAPNGTYRVGNNSQSNIAAAMFSPQTSSLAQLVQAAQDPWAFWYPR